MGGMMYSSPKLTKLTKKPALVAGFLLAKIIKNSYIKAS